MNNTLKLLESTFSYIPTDKGLNFIVCKEFNETFLNVYEVVIAGKHIIAECVDTIDNSPVIKVSIEYNDKSYDALFVLKEGEDNIIFNPTTLRHGSKILQTEKHLLEEIEADEIVLTETIVEDVVKPDVKLDIEKYKRDALKIIGENYIDKKSKIEDLKVGLVSLIEKNLSDIKSASVTDINTIKTQLHESVTEQVNNYKIDTDTSIAEINNIRENVLATVDLYVDNIKQVVSEKTEDLTSLQESVVFSINEKIAELDLVSENHRKEVEAAFTGLSQLANNSSIQLTGMVGEIYEDVSKAKQTTIDELNAELINVTTSVNSKLKDLQSKADKKISSISKLVESKISELQVEKDKTHIELVSAKNELVTSLQEAIKMFESETADKTAGLLEIKHQFLEQVKLQSDTISTTVNENKQEIQTLTAKITEAVEEKIKQINLVATKKEDLAQLKKQLEQRIDLESANIRKVLASYGGGGSVAVQYANGGTMNGSLNVNGRILSGGVDISTIWGGGTSTPGDYLPLSGGTVTGNVTVTGTLSTTTLYATSAYMTVIDIKQYELSGFDVTGNVTVNGQVSATTMATNYVDFTSLAAAPTHINGRLYYDQTEQTLVFMDGDPTLTYPINKLLWTTGVNKTESVIPKGSVVYLSGAQGNRGKMWPALATSDYRSADTIGVTMQSTAINQEGYIMTVGELQGIDTRNFAEGSTLYLSTTAAGGITSIKPQAPNHIVKVGFSLNSTVNGKIYVEIDNGYELDELHNVLINGVTNDQGLVYNSTSALWVNSNLYDGTDVKDLTANWQNTYTNLSAINNVVITDVLLYDVLSWGGSEWVNRTLIYPAPVTVHNDLNYIQGGNTNEYYHLSLSDYNNTLSVYSTVQANSATWTGGGGGGSDVSGLSANWQNTYTSFSTQSANNISVYSTVQSNSSYWPTTTLGSAAYTLSSSYFPINGNLEDINDVAVTSLSADQVLVWNGTTWVNRSFAVTAGARGAIYYPASGLSVISPYYDLLTYPIINGPIIQSATTSSGLGEVLINGYITNELNVNVIPAGLWTLNTYAYVNNVGGVSELIVRAYIRSADTTEREIFYNSSGELTTSAVLRISNTALSAIPTNLTDRLLVKFFAKTSTVSSKIVSYIQNTPNSYTTIQTPLEVVHNNLVGLQGGGSNEYYHQTLAQYNNASSVYTTVQSNSAQWAVDSTVDAGVRALTGNWQNTYTEFSAQSASNASVYSSFNAQSANNASVYSTVQANSATWTGGGGGSDVSGLSANWQNTYTSFSTQSANNISVYSTTNSNSANWLNDSYDEIWIGAGAMLAPTLSGATAATMPITAAGNEIYIDSFTFDSAATKYTQFDVSLPSNCNKQSIKAKFSWTTTTSAATGNVVWGIQARVLSDTNTIDGGWGTAQECTDTISGNTTFQVSSATAVLGLSGTSSADALLLFRIFRDATDAADTLAVNASLYGVKLQYSLAGSLSSSW